MTKDLERYLTIFDQLDFEKIIDHPNILIAANFWDKDRFLAAKTCYRFMRMIDDLIDNYKSENKAIALKDRVQFENEVIRWINSATEDNQSHRDNNDVILTMKRFKIPCWTMEAFARSMIYDIHYDGFTTLETFLDYCSGASIAPAAVFVHLCGVREAGAEYEAPDFDVQKIATPCAIFSYIVHIIRDFQKDQHNNLNYFADNIVADCGLDRQQLKLISAGGTIPQGFRQMIREYYNLADGYRKATCRMIQEIKPMLGARYQLSLEIIFDLYLMVFERINPDSGLFTQEELNPTSQEIRERVSRVIMNFQEVMQEAKIRS